MQGQIVYKEGFSVVGVAQKGLSSIKETRT